jgi:hypothetical protein
MNKLLVKNDKIISVRNLSMCTPRTMLDDLHKTFISNITVNSLMNLDRVHKGVVMKLTVEIEIKEVNV